MNHSFCSLCSRRQFLSNVTAGACCAAGGLILGGNLSRAAALKPAARTRVRVVFCETANDKPIWPNIGYDFVVRRKQTMGTLTKGCPQIEFSEACCMDDPKDAERALQGAGDVDGYIICAQGLGWRNDLNRLCTTGKPTLLADNLFGGSGRFLSQLPSIMKSGQPVDWLSSSRDQDLIDSARNFGLLRTGRSAAEVAEAFRETRRKNTPHAAHWSCRHDPVSEPNFDAAFRELRQTKILVVGGGWGGESFSKAAAEVTGVQMVPIDFKVLAAAVAEADRDGAREFAGRWIDGAQKVVEPTRHEIEKSGAMYLGMKKLLMQYQARGISINCLGGFYGGHLNAYPCLGFCQFNNDGLVGGCEGDQMSALTMVIIGTLIGRPGFISDPVIDTAKNSIVYAHCVATTHPLGPGNPPNPYRIRNHSEDRKGAALQSLLPSGYLTTTLEINPVSKQILMHQAKAMGNNSSDMACRTKLEAVVKGDIEKLTENWRMGWHRVTFYGDLRDCVTELSRRLKMELIEEA